MPEPVPARRVAYLPPKPEDLAAFYGVPIFDPRTHEDARHKIVTCARCGWVYLCQPRADYNVPAEESGWTGGPVCDACLLTIWEYKRHEVQDHR